MTMTEDSLAQPLSGQHLALTQCPRFTAFTRPDHVKCRSATAVKKPSGLYAVEPNLHERYLLKQVNI